MSIPLLESRGFVAGEWTHAANNATFDVFEPSSGEVLGSVANLGHADFVRAIDAAYEGYQEFSLKTTAKDRADMLLRWHQVIEENKEDRKPAPTPGSLTGLTRQ